MENECVTTAAICGFSTLQFSTVGLVAVVHRMGQLWDLTRSTAQILEKKMIDWFYSMIDSS